MCSIIGYLGKDRAAPILVNGLRRMEYRGYDSVGVATRPDGKISVRKDVGKVAEVNMSSKLDEMSGTVGIGHTRWATHGGITQANAHPHSSSSGRLALVHNGIIENYREIKEELVAAGIAFQSDTDTEVLANLLQKFYDKTGIALAAIQEAIKSIRGDYAFVAMFEDGTLAAARLNKPLIIGVGKNSYFLSSDVLGFIEKTDDAIYMDNASITILNRDGLSMCSFEGKPIKKQITKISKEFADAYKGEFGHYTIKEIKEQPDKILRCIEESSTAARNAADIIKDAKMVYITGSGTSYNAAMIAKHLFTRHTSVKTEPIVSSEAKFSLNSVESDSVLIAISQSGESADVLEAVRIAKKANAKIISIVNMLNSSLVQESHHVVPMNCGLEIGVAATKSFAAQLAIIYQMTERLCGRCLKVNFDEIASMASETLASTSAVKYIANEIKNVTDIYVLGSGIHYPVAVEAALKLKELAYIHAEAIAGGELKHGPLALIDSSSYVIAINPQDSTYQSMTNSISEVRTRGAKVIGISDRDSKDYEHWIKIPKMQEDLHPIVEIIPVQLLSYYTARKKDVDPDYPRNLAKSVTV